MHMPDALVSPAVGGTLWGVAVLAAGYAARRLRHGSDSLKSISLMGVSGALVFAAQMINIPIAHTGASGHIGGAVLLTMLLGPSAAFITLAAILVLQALLFGDGGLLALGCNIVNMGFWGCFVADALILRPMLTAFTPRRLTLAVMLASVFSLQCGSLGVVLETTLSGVTALPFAAFLATMQPIHLLIGLLEGAITASVLGFIYRNRPDALTHADAPKGVSPLGALCAVLALAAIATVVCLAPFASEKPDGLEWSVERVAGEAAPEEQSPYAAPMPDYETAGAGLIGGIATLTLCAGLAFCLKRRPA